MKLGDAATILAMLAWLSASVGPWWLGLVLFFGGMLINICTYARTQISTSEGRPI